MLVHAILPLTGALLVFRRDDNMMLGASAFRWQAVKVVIRLTSVRPMLIRLREAMLDVFNVVDQIAEGVGGYGGH
jgi:hypothetical protein